MRLEGIRSHLMTVSDGRTGVRRRDIDSRYLLSGFARCAVCGGALGVMSGSHRSVRTHMYGCLAYLKRGTSVCGNGLRLPIQRVDDAVLATLAGTELRPPVVMAVIDGVIQQLGPQSRVGQLEHLLAERDQAGRAVSNLSRAIAVAGGLEPLLKDLGAVRARWGELSAAIATLEQTDVVRRFDRHAVDTRVREQLDRWRALLSTMRVADGRQYLREVLAAPLRFTPDGKIYRFAGALSFGGLLAGMADVAPFLVAVRGIEPRFDG